jgi:WhiB family redox-sensing transcriptional regulator
MPWENDARCLQYDPEIFFATRARAERRAKAICSRCPVRVECLAFALESKVEFGVWGGLNGRERRALTRQSPRTNDWRELAAARASA